MERRAFVKLAGAAVAAGAGRTPAGFVTPRLEPSAVLQQPTLTPEVFTRRMQNAQQELQQRHLDLLIATPSTNFAYLTGYDPERSERLIALLLPPDGAGLIVCPAFEVDRLKANTGITDFLPWQEAQDPYRLLRDWVRKPKFRGTAAIEPSTAYDTFLKLQSGIGTWEYKDGAPIFERLRIVKTPAEIALIRRAVEITQAAMAATFAQLAEGQSEQEVARILSREMENRGAPGGGLVQFGPDSALPHGGPTPTRLARDMPVLIDCGCRVSGYTSDITRTIWFGDSPTDEFKKVFNLVYDAQTAVITSAKPVVSQAQDLDRAARKVIADAGYGQYFTHRLGHGLGMDGHEVPYLVEGDEIRLETGMVFTIEPGIYQPGKFGVRIEDDAQMTENGVELLSTRPPKY